jgi:hypothetical protein
LVSLQAKPSGAVGSEAASQAQPISGSQRQGLAAYCEVDARRKKSVNRMPKWADKRKVLIFYEMAADLGLSVDHIIPLQERTSAAYMWRIVCR